MDLIEFTFGALTGVTGNAIYELLKNSISLEKLLKLIEYKNANNSSDFKTEIETILEYNQQLKKELEKLQTQEKKSVSQQNTHGNNNYSEGNQTNIQNQNNYYSEKSKEVKKN